MAKKKSKVSNKVEVAGWVAWKDKAAGWWRDAVAWVRWNLLPYLGFPMDTRIGQWLLVAGAAASLVTACAILRHRGPSAPKGGTHASSKEAPPKADGAGGKKARR